MFRHMATYAEKAIAQCSKCNAAPIAGDYDVWCKECRNKYQREYYALNKWRAERSGIIRGIQAMREHIAQHFAQWNGRPFMGAEVVSVVGTLPGPAVAAEDAAKAQ